MKKITSSQYDKIEYNHLNSYYRIGFYDENKNQFVEIARWRNSHSTIGANYGLLQIWACTFDFACFASQGSNNVCGGYNKPIANLEHCLYEFRKEHSEFEFSDCGSIDSLLKGLMEYLQKQYIKKLFLLAC